MKLPSFRFNLQEVGGALGDLGTLIPIAVALITLNRMNATSVFLVVGLAYIAAGLFYRLPMPVQPLKAVATIAIAGGLSSSVISASGLVMAAVLLLIAWTGAIGLVARLFPRVIVRGVQLGVGLLLLRAGLMLINQNQVIAGGGDSSVLLADASIPMGWLVALALGGVCILFLRSKRLPASLVLLAVGIGVGIFWGSLQELQSMRLALSLPPVAVPSAKDILTALVLLVIPQIPLTLGNAVFATADTARAYFGPQAQRVTAKALLTTMGVTNLGAGLLGGMPICHGSGGLTAHFRLGARTGGAALLIGVPFVAMALFLDGNVLPVLSLIPFPVLGLLLVFVGVQHSLLVRDLRSKKEFMIAAAVAIPGLITANLAVGVASGIAVHLIFASLSRRHAIWSALLSTARRRSGLDRTGPEKMGTVNSEVSLPGSS